MVTAMTQRTLVDLGREECLSLLRTQRVGRLVYCDEAGPVAIPVNFALAGEDVVMRMEPTNRALSETGMVAFEADRVDDQIGSGWSVMVRGPADELTIDEVPGLLHQMVDGPPLPWAGGIHNVWVRIRAFSITGRRLGDPAAPLVM
jgi:hypothetical protein